MLRSLFDGRGSRWTYERLSTKLLGLIPDNFPIPIVLSGGIAKPCHIDLLMSYRDKWLSGVAIGTAFHSDTQQISLLNDKYLL